MSEKMTLKLGKKGLKTPCFYEKKRNKIAKNPVCAKKKWHTSSFLTRAQTLGI